MKYVIIGNGYVGNYLLSALPNAVLVTDKIWSREQICKLMLDTHPSSVLINCAGKIGKPNVDWCEDHKDVVFGANVGLPVMIAEACKEIKQPWIHIGSGCIYDGYDKWWAEDDAPNFYGSFYSKTKAWSQTILSQYDEVCILRIRMPIDEDLSDRSYVGKVIKYAKAGCSILSAPNSVTYLSDLAMAIIGLAEKGQTGTFNVVSPGALTSKNVLTLWENNIEPGIDPQFEATEQVLATLKAGRSNCILSTVKLAGEGIVFEDAFRKLDGLVKAKKQKAEV